MFDKLVCQLVKEGEHALTTSWKKELDEFEHCTQNQPVTHFDSELIIITYETWPIFPLCANLIIKSSHLNELLQVSYKT
jgi:hypothetical protein